MKTPIVNYIAFFLFLTFITSCKTSTSVLKSLENGMAIIEDENGNFSEKMSVKIAFGKLESNQKIYLGKGRVELIEPLKLGNLENIEIIGNNAELVAKIDMPIITISNSTNVKIDDMLVVHEIGEWCAQNCIELYDVTDVEVKNCRFDGSGYFGLALTGVKNALVENNQFFNCEYGLAAWRSEKLTVKNNRFFKNRNLNIMSNERTQFENDFENENEFDKE
jgi:parallel beta-helix repeat protein